MKTVTDIAQLLKRNPKQVLSLILLGNGNFEISLNGSDYHQSKYLDDALENLAESLRRAANGEGDIRKAKETSSATTTQAKALIPGTYAINIPMSISYAPTQPQYPTCPKCGSLPQGMADPSSSSVICGGCNHLWLVGIGTRTQFLPGDIWTFDGNAWKSTP